MRVLWGNRPGGPGRRDRKWAFAAGAVAVVAAFFIQFAWERDMTSLQRREEAGGEETVISRAVAPSGSAVDSVKEEEGEAQKSAGVEEGGGEETAAGETAQAESAEIPESSAASDASQEAEEGSETAPEEEEAENAERAEGETAGSAGGSEGRPEPESRAVNEEKREEPEPSGTYREPAPEPAGQEPEPAAPQYAVSDYGPGDLVGEDVVYALGSGSFFSETEISDSLFQRIYGKSYKEDCIIPREDLRYIRVLYYDFYGNRRSGELVSNKAISGDLVEIFRELYNQQYRIERIRLVDDYDADDDWSSSENNTSCFNYRTVAGKSTLSLHARGLAIDINPRYNPNVFYDEAGTVTGCLPANGMDYADRSRNFPHKIDENDLCVRLFKERGFTWGGDWSREPDYMHFSKSSAPES